MKPTAPVAPASARAARWALGLALAGGLLAVSPLQASAYSILKLFTLSLGVALAWAAIALQGAPMRSTPLDRPLLACGAALLASLAASQDPFLSFVGRYRMYAMGVVPLSLCAALFYAAVFSGQAEEPRPLLRLLAAVGLVMGVHALLQYNGIEPLSHMPDKLPQGRAVGTLGSPVYFGSTLVCLFPLALALALDGRGGDRVLGAAGALGAATALACTVSRGAWLGAAAGAAAYLALSGRLRLPRGRWLVAAALAAGVAGTGFLQLRRSSAGSSDSARIELWRSALASVGRNPFLGSGPDTFEQLLRRHRTEGFIRALGANSGQANAHNDLLQTLTTMGAAGLAAYLWLVAAAAALAWKARGPEAPFKAAAAGALAGLFLQAKFNPAPLPSLILAAFCAALLVPPPPPGREKRAGWAGASVALVCAALLALSWRLTLADRSQKKAQVFAAVGRADIAAAEFARAERLNPGEVQYRMVHAQRLYAWAGAERDPARRLRLLERAVALGREATRWRPNDVDAHQILGVSLYYLRQAGGPDTLAEAEASLDRALELDPFFTHLLTNRLKVAQARGDLSKASALAAEIARLDALSHERR